MAGQGLASTRAGEVHFIFIMDMASQKNKTTYGRTLNLFVHTGKGHQSPFIFCLL